ncbi:hypothetical protein [Brevundimonas sp.]|uniref:hypothetical protein n=1 Tax=Brevundimonas sp. TaxID=1871086 RepID=UPI003D6CD61D
MASFPADEAEALALVLGTPLFQAEWYLQRYPDVAAAGMDPATHFLLHGGHERRDPSPLFRTRWYLSQDAEIETTGVNPLIHYLVKGQALGRSPLSPQERVLSPELTQDIETLLASGLFDAEWYRAHTPGLPKGRATVAQHYLETGATSGKNPGPDFDTRAYWKAHADVEAAGANPLLHYLRHGRSEGRSIFAVQTAPPPPSSQAPDFEPFDITMEDWVSAHDLAALAEQESLSLDGVVLGRVSPENRHRLAASAAAFSSDPRRRREAARDASARIAPWIADLWFINDDTLRLRLNLAGHAGAASQILVARAYQRDLESGALRLLDEAPVRASFAPIVDARLPNPYSPVLLTLSDAQGEVVEIQALAFPSLARHGAHHAELTVLSETPSPEADLWRVSAELWNEMTTGPATGLSISRLVVDLGGAIGGERIFSATCLDWLTHVMALRPEAVGAPQEADADSLRSALARAPMVEARRRAASALTLTVSGDSLPSISALVSRRLPTALSAALAGGYVAADASRARPRWSVFPASAAPDLSNLQPRNAALAWPLLSRERETAAADLRPAPPAFPLAVRFLDERFEPTTAERLSPTALDVDGPLLRRALTAGERSGAAIAAVMLASETDSALSADLAALAAQTLPVEEVTLVFEGDARATALALAEACFPGRVRVIDGAQSRAGLLNRAAAGAAGDHLLFVGAGVVLHDPRTLETLLAMARTEGATSAGCIAVEQHDGRNDWRVRVRGGGLLPSHISFTTSPRLVMREARSVSALPPMTYTVAANPFRLALVPRRAWDALGGLDEGRFPHCDYDLDFGLRGLDAGGLQLCTSAVSVSALETGLTDDRIDVVTPHVLGAGNWCRMLAGLTNIRELA